MNKICTSIEQSKKLIELGLDVNTADMFWDLLDGDEPDEKIPNCYWDRFDITINEFVPAWSLSALIELIPDKISINNESYYLSFTKKSVEFRGPITWDGQKAKSFEMDNILDAAFEMVCWVINNGHLKGK